MPIKWFRAIKKIDFYILTEVFAPFFGGIVFFTFVFLMFQLLRLAEFFIIHGVSLALLGELVFYMILSFIPMALPIAFLIAVLMAFGRLSSESELIAMKACGMSFNRIAKPVFGFSLIVVLFSLAFNLEWVPWAERNFKTLLIRISNTKAVSAIKAGTFTTGFFDLLIYADQVDSNTNQMKKVFIFDEREAKNPLIVIAQEGQILPVKTGSQLSVAAMMNLKNGNIHKNDLASETYQKMNFKEYNLYLNINEGEDTANHKPKTIDFRSLLHMIKSPEVDEHYKFELRTEFWRRISIALCPFIFVFVGVGYGTVRSRSVRASAMLVTFIVLAFFWGMQATLLPYAYDEKITPWIAMMIPNFIILLGGLYGYKKSSW